MSLTVVSEDTRREVENDWMAILDVQSVFDYADKMTERLKKTNPVVAQFFESLLANRADLVSVLHVLSVTYACRVYRMLELTQAVVIVSHETSAPVQTEFLRDYNAFGQDIIDKLMVENPEILNTGRPLIEEFEETGDARSSSRVLTFGLLLYKIIDGQKDADELAASLESFGANTGK